jgi:predicted lipoprotein
MLTALADQVITQAYDGFHTQMIMLNQAGMNFVAEPDQTTLSNLRNGWFNAYKVWQYIEMFNIGKAEELQYSFYMNVYPLSVTDVENNITNGGYDLYAVGNQDAVGFPALDYLLYGLADNDADILAKYTTDVNADGYKTYLTDVLTQMDDLTRLVVNDWGEGYRDTFINNSGNTSTSSLNILVNSFVQYYEKKLRANKIGIPAGVFSGNPLPDKVEALYRKNGSKELAEIALQAVEDFFNGKQYNGGAEAESFKTYLSYLDRDDISNNILSQINTAQAQLNSLSNNFYEQVNTDNSQMLMTYDELQKVVVFIKNDMPNAFNVSIVFQDNDGD